MIDGHRLGTLARRRNAYDANYGATGWAGLTSYSYNGSYEFIDGSVPGVTFNDYYSYTSSELQQDACHEKGHAIGLDHDFYKN